MGDYDQSQALLKIAQQELSALKLFKDLEIAENIFGFHAQQAVEKTLKAWLSFKGVEYPKVHDLSLLLKLLEEQGEKVEEFKELIFLNPFAVQFRYEAWEDLKLSMTRERLIEKIENLQKKVMRLFS